MDMGNTEPQRASEDVRAYALRLKILLTRASRDIKTEDARAVLNSVCKLSFVRGLDLSIRREVISKNAETFEKAIEEAVLEESRLKHYQPVAEVSCLKGRLPAT